MSSNLSKVLVLAVLTLVSTTIDDFVVLLSFCSENEASPISQAEKNSTYWKIATGYLAGFTIVVAISLLGLVLSYLVQPEYIALLGFIPILIGFKMLYDAYKEGDLEESYYYYRHCKKREEPAESDLPVTVTSPASAGPSATSEDHVPERVVHRVHSHVRRHSSLRNNLLEDSEQTPLEGHEEYPAGSAAEGGKSTYDPEAVRDAHLTQPIAGEVTNHHNNDETAVATTAPAGEEEGEEDMNYFAKKLENCLLSCGINRQFVIVAATTFSVGSDNIAVYVSLFSQSDGGDIALIIAVFYFMTTIYAMICIFVIGNVKGLGETLDIMAKPIVPFVLMGIGAYILSDSILFM